MKREPLVGETRMEIESAVAKQTKKCDFSINFKRLSEQLY